MKKKLIKILITELIIISALFIVISYKTFEGTDVIKDIFEGFAYEEGRSFNLDNNMSNTENYHINEEINVNEIIRNGLLEGEESIKIDWNLVEGGIENFFNIVDEVLLDTPEIMYYISGKYSNAIFIPKYSKTIEEKQAHQKIVNRKRDEIISQIIDTNMSEYEKVKAIHDFVVNNTQYDKRDFASGNIPDESYTVYGVLIEGIAVCEGYAKAIKYLLDAVGIESLIVTGKANGDNHAWNIVNVEGDYYHLDATWNDPVTDDGSEILIYDYFNLKDADIEKTHFWDKEKYPRCNSNKYNYYYHNGLIVNNYEDFYNKIKTALIDNKKEVLMKIVDHYGEVYDIPSAINKIAADNPNIINIRKYRYSIETNQGIVRIFFFN